MADTREQEPKPLGAADPGAEPRGDEPTAGQPAQAADAAAVPREEPKAAGAAPAVAPQPEQPSGPATPGAEPKKEKKPADGGGQQPAEPAGPPPEPAPRPRLLDHYEQRVRPKLAQQFGLGNAHEIPKLVKIVLNSWL